MNASLLPHFVAVVEPVLGSVAPSPAVAFVMQVAGVFGMVGSAVALRARRRDPDADVWRITAAWNVLGLVAGACAAVASLF